ncbi:MAG: heme exporter protein CcmB [Pacificimonas sp.]
MTFLQLVRRHCRWRDMPVALAFFMLAIVLFAFAAGPDAQFTARFGDAALWTAALLATVLPVATMFAGERTNGTLDQLRMSGMAMETVAVARLLSHWLAFTPTLLFGVLLGGVLLDEPSGANLLIFLGASPGLAATALVAASLTERARGGAALAALLLPPLALPILIFGTGGSIRLVLASSLFLATVAPFAAAAALRLR